MYRKLVPDPLLISAYSPKQPISAADSFESKLFLKVTEIYYQKTFKRELDFFYLHPVSFYGQNYEKQKKALK